MNLKWIGLFAALALVAGCSSKSETSGTEQGATANGGISSSSTAAPGTEADLAQNVGDRVFFEYDKSDLSGEARQTLDRQAAWLKRYPTVHVVIEGHCDERGTREYNMALGARRANSVKSYLVAL